MKENKSIDGLTLRDAPKKVAPKKTSSATVTVKKTATTKPKTAPVKPKPVKKLAVKEVSEPVKEEKVKTVEVEEPKQTVEDFLKPGHALCREEVRDPERRSGQRRYAGQRHLHLHQRAGEDDQDRGYPVC